VLPSTFNEPNSNYFVTIDDNTVKNLQNNQPIIGIGENIWHFKTGENQYKYSGKFKILLNNEYNHKCKLIYFKFTDNLIGEFFLTKEGADNFEQLSSIEKVGYFDTLNEQLAVIIPTDKNRLDHFRYSESKISLRIKPTFDLKTKSSDQIKNDLDVLIKNKDFTAISQFNVTKYIDSNNGFQLSSKYNIWFLYYLFS